LRADWVSQRGNEDFLSDPSQIGPFGAPNTTPTAEFRPPKVRLQRFSPRICCRYPPHRGLSPPHKTPLLGSTLAIGPSGALRTQGDDVQTAWSVTANLTPRLPPDAAGRAGPAQGPRKTGGGPPPLPPAGTRHTSRATRPSPRS